MSGKRRSDSGSSVSALGHKRSFKILAAQWPLSGVKQPFVSFDIANNPGRFRPEAAILL